MRSGVARALKILAIGLAAAVVAVVLALGWFLGTGGGRARVSGEAVRRLAAATGLEARIGEWQLAWPWSLTLHEITLRDSTMAEGSGIHVAELAIVIEPRAFLATRTLAISRLTLRGVQIDVPRDADGKLRFPRVRARAPRDTASGGAPPLHQILVRELEVVDASVRVAPSTSGRPFAVDSLALRAGVDIHLAPDVAGNVELRALAAVIRDYDLAVESANGALELGPAPLPKVTLEPLVLRLAGSPITVRATGGRDKAVVEIDAPSIPAGALGRLHPSLARFPAARLTLHAEGPPDRSQPIDIAAVLHAEGARAEVRGTLGSGSEARSAALTLAITGFDPSRFHSAAPAGRLALTGTADVALPKGSPRRVQFDLRFGTSVLRGVPIDRAQASGRLTGKLLDVTTEIDAAGARLAGRGRREPDGRLAFTAEVASHDLARLEPLIGVALEGDLMARVEASGQPRQLAGSADFRGNTVTIAERAALWGVTGEVTLEPRGADRLHLTMTADSARVGGSERTALRLHALDLAADASPAGGTGFAPPIVVDAELTADALLPGSATDPEPLLLAGGARLGSPRWSYFTAHVDTLAVGDRMRLQGKVEREPRGDSLRLALDRFDLRLLDPFLAPKVAADSTALALAATDSVLAATGSVVAAADSNVAAADVDTTAVRLAGLVSGTVELVDQRGGVTGHIELTANGLESSVWPMSPLTAHVTADLAPHTLAGRVLIEGPRSLAAVTGELAAGVRMASGPRLELREREASVVMKAMGDSLGPLIAPLLANAPPRPSIDSVIARAKGAAFAASLDARGAIRNPNGHAALLLDFPAEKGFGKAVLHATAHRDRDTLRALVRADLEHASAPIVIEAQAPLAINLERGTVSLLPDAPLAGKVAIDAFDLGLLEPYLPDDVELAGPLDLNATISGTRAAPRAQGRVELGGGRLAHKAYGLELDSLRIAADFDKDRITLHEASGKTEKGHLRLSGGVPVQGGGGDSLAGALEITGLTLRTPHGAVAEGGAAVAVSGAFRRPLLRGRIVLTKATIPVPERNRKVVRIPADDPWLRGSQVGTPAKAAKVSRRLPVDLDLEVDVPRNLWLENKNIDVEIGGNLKLTTPEEMLRITGELKARQGSVRLLRRRFEVTKGTVTFFGGEVIAPEIDIEAETEVNTTTVTIHLTGSVVEPRLEFKSDPVLEQGDIVSLLVIGRTSDELTSGERSLVGDQARTVAANYVSRELEAQLGSELGLDLVEIDTGGEQDRVSVGKYVTSRTLLRVYQQFGTETGGGITVEYALTDDFDLQVTAEDDGENGLDLLWQPR